MKINKKRLTLISAFIFIFGGALFAVVHISISNSEAFAEAEHFLRASDKVTSRLGTVERVDLPWFGEAYLSFSENGGEAKLSLDLTGTIANGIAEVELKRTLQVWKVSVAQFKLDSTRDIINLTAD